MPDQQLEQWRQQKYEDAFTRAYRSLCSRHRDAPADTVDEARGQLQSMYIAEGNDWVGRGEAWRIEQTAAIDAYERFLREQTESEEGAP